MLWSSVLLASVLPLGYGRFAGGYNDPMQLQFTRPQTVLTGSELATLHLSSVPPHGFTVLSHPHFPHHQVRVKKTQFCDPTVNVYTGYLDVDAGAKHLFFYFFESRHRLSSEPASSDDVMMWINGGPGCSSATGLLMELGPCNIDMNTNSSNGTQWNPRSWNEEANIFFLDQPVGVGFSYADYGETIETTEAAAKNVHAFITIFFESFPQFSGRRLHLAGESYGGRYLPVFASEVYDQNQTALRESRPTLNLQSVLIGNGNTDISTLYRGKYEVECGRASLDVPFQSISACVRMKMALPRCQKHLQEDCVDHFDLINCRAAVTFCDSELSTAMWATGENVYDISKMCEGDGNLCYMEEAAIDEYLNLPEIRELLGVESPSNFSSCSDPVFRDFNSNMDKWRVHTPDYVANLLDRGIRFLIYAGTYDWQCNWVANKLWVDKLSWSQSDVYKQESWREWTVDGKVAGETKETDSLTFVTIRGAGHMFMFTDIESLTFYVPHDKPAEALAMVSRWLAGERM
ncbi:Carboxypeptidase Y [Leucoagaricus sp. SymC.cos]|nr:Carboxypeptidase Y [Leucoagaricus sp. SymC.cos]